MKNIFSINTFRILTARFFVKNRCVRQWRHIAATLIFGTASTFIHAEEISTLTTTTNTASENLISALAMQQVNSADAAKGAAVKPSLETEKAIFSFFSSIESYCAAKMNSLQSAQSAAAKKDAHINAWGAVIALVGGVTVYAPAKAILMGIGISSSGGSNSVLGGMANSITNQQATTADEINALKTNYVSAVSTYTNIDLKDDVFGTKRFNALTQLKAMCDGLAVSNK